MVLWLGPKRNEAKVDGVEIETIAATPETLPGVHRGDCARALGGRPSPYHAAATKKIDAVRRDASRPRGSASRSGAGTALDSLSIEMLHGLVLDLNKTTRFSGLPLGADANASGVVQASGWMTGFPVRTSLAAAFPEHDTWRFDATRLIESGEADAALWISAYGREAAALEQTDIPLVALVPPKRRPPRSRRSASRSAAPAMIMTARSSRGKPASIVAPRIGVARPLPSVAESIAESRKTFGGGAEC